MTQVTLTNKSIKKILKDHQIAESKIENAISEYIWNGFDAGGTTIELEYSLAGVEFAHTPRFKKLKIKDNGSGIDFFKLDTEFTPFYDSEKASIPIEERHHSDLHGKNGIGRLSFSAFAHRAIWYTTFNSNGKRLKYQIEINDANIGNYENTHENELVETGKPTGTVVEITNFSILKSYNSGYKPLENTILEHLKRAFAWKLELNKDNDYKIEINGKKLDYKDIIDNQDEKTIVYPESNITFKIRCILWNCTLIDEFSRYYYIGSDGKEKYKENTGFNNKGDNFYHSVFIQSDFFNGFTFDGLGEKTRSSPEFKFLQREVRQFLREKRKPFLRKMSSQIIAKYEKDGHIVKKGKTPLQLIEIEDLERVIKEMFVTEPLIFSDLSPTQIKTLIEFLRLVLNSDEREHVLEIVQNVVISLSAEERKNFCQILQVSELNKIIQTIEMVTKRYEVLKILKEIVFKNEYEANERDHLQNIVAPNYWIFGEQYNLVSEDEDFEAALRNYLHILRGIKKEVWMKDPNKKDRADIFICRQERRSNSVHSIIVELKHPTKVKLGSTEFNQVMEYLGIITNEPRFSGESHTFDFYLIGTNFDKTGYIDTILENKKSMGLPGLALESTKYRIFVKKWCDVITQCELRHDFIDEKLKLKKDKLIENIGSAEEAVKMAQAAALKISG